MKLIKNSIRTSTDRDNVPEELRFNFAHMDSWRKNLLIIFLAGLTLTLAMLSIITLLNQVKVENTVIKTRGDQAIIISEMGSIIKTKLFRISEYINQPDQTTIDEYNTLTDDFEILNRIIEPQMESNKLKTILNQLYEDSRTIDNIFLKSIVPKVNSNNKAAAELERDRATSIRSEVDDSLTVLRKTMMNDLSYSLEKANNAVNTTKFLLLLCLSIAAIAGCTIIILDLRSNERKYTALFRNTSNGLAQYQVVYNADNKPINYIFLEVNKAFEEMSGHIHNDLYRQRITAVMPQINQLDFDWLAVLEEVVYSGEAKHLEVFIPPWNKWFSLSAYSLGKNYIVVEHCDIDERKQHDNAIHEKNLELQQTYEDLQSSFEEVEAIAGELEESQYNLITTNEELAKSQERLELALWGAKAGMWDWVLATGKITINKRYAEIYGFALHDFQPDIGEWKKRVHPEDYPVVAEKLYAHINGKSSHYEAEYRIKNKQEEWVWIIDSGKAVNCDNQGQALRATGTIQVINDRKKAEQALANSQAIYQGVFNSTDNPIFLLDTRNIKILQANPAAQKLSGYSLDELEALDFKRLSPLGPNARHKLFQECIHDLESNGHSAMQTIGRKKNGEELAVLVNLHIMTDAEEDIVLAVVNDLSEQHKYEEERDKRAHYEAQALKMTTLSAMSAGVVHEISQPLNAIKLLADGMIFWQESGRDIDVTEALTALQNISAQAERINNIIIHMRNLANAGDDGEFSPCDVNAACSVAMNLLGRQLANHGITAKLELNNDLPPVLGQQQRLEEVVINLLSNAMRALDERDQINKYIRCRTHQEGQYILLEIADNGPGISPEIGQFIWEPFYSTQKGGEGMGLGLAIVHSIISKFSGTIHYHNNAWGGATFQIELPLLKAN